MVKPKRSEQWSRDTCCVVYEISSLAAMNSSPKVRPSASLDKRMTMFYRLKKRRYQDQYHLAVLAFQIISDAPNETNQKTGLESRDEQRYQQRDGLNKSPC